MKPISSIVWVTFLGSCALQGAPAAISGSPARYWMGLALYGDWR